LNTFLTRTFTTRPLFNEHPEYKYILKGNYNLFAGRLPNYFVNKNDHIYGKFIIDNLFTSSELTKGNDYIIEKIILYIKYAIHTHNNYCDWGEYVDKVNDELLKKYFDVDYKNNYKNRANETNLLTSLFLIADCREHSFLLSYLYTLYVFMMVDDCILKNVKVITTLKTLAKFHMRIGTHKMYINSGISNGALSSTGLKYLNTKVNGQGDPILLMNGKIISDPHAKVRNLIGCKTINCTQLVNKGDHVFCYLYAANHHTKVNIKDTLYSNIYSYNIPNKFNSMFTHHNKVINQNNIIQIGDEIMIQNQTLEQGIELYTQFQPFSCYVIDITNNTELKEHIRWFGKNFIESYPDKQINWDFKYKKFIEPLIGTSGSLLELKDYYLHLANTFSAHINIKYPYLKLELNDIISLYNMKQNGMITIDLVNSQLNNSDHEHDFYEKLLIPV
jgi:hypothetical protein